MKSIYNVADTSEILERIAKLSPSTQAKWGKMSVSQMLAHCNVSYEMTYENKHKKPNIILRLILKTLVKPSVVNEKPYKHSLKSAPAFIITNSKYFEEEKNRLVAYIDKTQKLGAAHFDGKESHSFGVLTKQEWNNMFYKHLDHHLSQFGV